MTHREKARLRYISQRLKRAWHEATFLQGQTTPAAKHLFDTASVALQLLQKEIIDG